MFEIDWVIIIPHNDTFSDIGQKPPFSVILWQLEGQSWAGPKTITLVQNHEKYLKMSALKDTDEILIIKKKKL